MTLHPSFSIIIPTYNAGNYLEKCLDSIIAQKYTYKEIIIVDGYSTDNTIEIIEAYKKKNPWIIATIQKDKGIYDAMNIGLRIATGDWFYFLGSDDTLYDEQVLHKVSSYIAQHAKSKIFYGDVLTSDNYIQSYPAYTYKKLISLNICHQSIFYHKSLFEKDQYDLKYPICADWDFNLKVFRKRNHPIYINQTIAKYNLEGASKNWRTHPDYLNNFYSLKMVLRYRTYLYFGLLYSSSQIRRIGISMLRRLKWIFQ